MTPSRPPVWFWVVFVIAFAAVRVLPALTPFDGEDGIFARVMRASWTTTQAPVSIRIGDHDMAVIHGLIDPRFPGLVGRVGGRDLYIGLDHPVLGYRLQSIVGAMAARFGPDERSPAIEPFMRAQLAAASLIPWLAIAALAFRVTRNRWPAAAVCAAAISPLPAITSTMMPFDGNVGLLLVGALSVALLATSLSAAPTAAVVIGVAASSFLLGLGKQEWTIAMLAGVGLWAALSVAQPARDAARPWRRCVAWLCGSLIGGNLASALYDSRNYLGAFRVIRDFGAPESTIGANLWRVVRVTYGRLPMLFTLLPLLAILAVVVLASKRRHWPMHPMGLLLASCGLMLCVAYLASSWNQTPRYLAPGFLMAAAAFAAVWPAMPRATAVRCAQLLVAAALLHTVVLQVKWLREPPLVRPPVDARRDCLPAYDTAVTWNRPEIDFISTNISASAAADMARGFGRTLCK